MKYSPIALFTYNRFHHTVQTIHSLQKNHLANKSDLYIFSDAGKDEEDKKTVEKIRNTLKNIKGFKSITIKENSENKGLANSIINGLNFLFSNYDRVIVLEDDLISSPHFLSYMNNALSFYQPEEIWSISGYSPIIKIPQKYTFNTYVAPRNCSWGWATWKQNWIKTDWNITDFELFICNTNERKKFESGGNDLSVMLLKQYKNSINSWSIRFNYAAFKYNKPTIYPINTMIKNMGVDGSGTNMKSSNKYDVVLGDLNLKETLFCPSTYYNATIIKSFKQFYNTSLFRRFINFYKITMEIMEIKKRR